MTVRLIESSPSFFINTPPPPQKNRFQRLFSSMHKEIDSLADPLINLKHLKATNLSINLEEIPDSIQIEQLRELFQEINFEKPDHPGYMPSSTRKDDDFTYSQQELYGALNQFLGRMQKKTAFSGTPPENTSEIKSFFAHIENVVRFCLYKVNKNYDEFMQKLGGIPPDSKDSNYKTYEDLLQAKARLVIDIALTGGHCGGRFMGTSIELYQTLRADREPEGSLQNSLQGILSNLRERIANAQIAKLVNSLNSSLQQEHTAHAISSYMAKLGPILGLPGTKDCIEQSTLIPTSKSRLLRDFFQSYTPTSIKNEIKQKISSSQKLRESVVDWIKEQAGTWKQHEYNEKALDLLQEITLIQTEKNTSPLLDTVLLWQDLLAHLIFVEAQLPSKVHNWKNYVVEVISLEESKAFLKQKNLSFYSRIQFQNDLSSSKMESLCIEPLPLHELQQKASKLDKIKAINQTILAKGFQSLSEETLLRCLEGQANLHEALKDHSNRARQGEFLLSIQPFIEDSSQRVKIRPEILNWILSSSEILYV